MLVIARTCLLCDVGFLCLAVFVSACGLSIVMCLLSLLFRRFLFVCVCVCVRLRSDL